MFDNIIKLLPDNIANQIAAGEVVQRPASVVKELLENSIDAAATSIQLIVKDAGKTLIQVTDNGSGMSDTDARLSFERHATSKITNADDLYALRTLGFRGEALASIAAVAQVELKTKTHDAISGTHIIIEANEVLSQKPCSATTGSNFSIKNLFYNVPARRNFLKSNPVEMRHIIDEFLHIALPYYNVNISLHHNDLELYNLPSSSLEQRALSLLGSSYKQMLVAVDEDTSIVKITGYVGKPEVAKKTRGDQFFFVNRRYIKSPMLHHAVASAYESLMTKDKYASYVLFLEIHPEKIDINVHPTKHEIKFEDERHIYTILNATVRQALGQLLPNIHALPAQSLVASSNYVTQSMNSSTILQNRNPATYNPQDTLHSRNQQQQWQALIDDTLAQKNQSLATPLPHIVPSIFDADDHDTKYSMPYQLHSQYIISPIRNGFIIINQEAAHQRILFERFLDKLHQRKGNVQRVLFPKTIDFSPSNALLLNEIMDDILAIGFELQPLGPHTFLVNGVPNEMQNDDEQRVIESILEQYKDNKNKLRMPHSESIAKSLAFNAGIKKGKTLNEREMKQLIDELFACQQPEHSPFGDKTYIRVGLDELTRMLV